MPYVRPRLKFSLRTLFVVVMVLCVSLGYWRYTIIRQRKQFLDPSSDAFCVRTVMFGKPVMWTLGGPSVEQLSIYDKDRETEARRLFPEAIVFVDESPKDRPFSTPPQQSDEPY